MVGYAYQIGALPLSAERDRAGDRAQRRSGRDEPGRVPLGPPRRRRPCGRGGAGRSPKEVDENRRLSQSFAETVERRVAFLTAYQNAAYAARYRALVDKTKAVEAAKAPGKTGLAEAVARYLFKLMAYKDEYEVARLYTDGAFEKQVKAELRRRQPALRVPSRAADPRPRTDRRTGEPKKMSFGPWMLTAFRVLAKFKFLRGTAFDPFGYGVERRTERKLVADYEAMLGGASRQAHARQPRARGRARGHPGKNPRLRPRQGAPSRGRQGRRGGAAGAVPRRPRADAQGGGIDQSDARSGSCSRSREPLELARKPSRKAARYALFERAD